MKPRFPRFSRFAKPASSAACAIFLGVLLIHAAAPEAPREFPAFAQSTNSPLRDLGGGNFEIGLVRFNRAEKRLSFLATVNMSQGLIEYFLVHSTGKIHESVLKTETQPYHVHLAVLLLSPTNSGAVPPLKISVAWNDGKGEKKSSAEDMIFNSQFKSKMSAGSWAYTGSRTVEGVFLAQRDGNFIAVYEDPDALINNPRPGRDNDEIWQAATNSVPPVGTPVQVTLQLESGVHPK